jgi:hypothetical protein
MDRQNLFCHLGVATVLLTAAYALVLRPKRVLFIRLVATAGMLLAMVWTWSTYEMPYDFKRFWHVGRDLAQGVDYYGLNPRAERQLILNPPTVLPLFRAWAQLPLRKSARIWVALNVLGGMALVPLAYVTVRAQMGPDAPTLPRSTLAILAAAIGLSSSQIMGLALGQVSVLMSAALFLALYAQATSRPRLAGVCLAIATVKINTMLPFLMLFLRKRDRVSWITLVSTCLIFILATGHPLELPKQLATTWQTIRVTYEPGQVNDYTFAGPSHASLIGLDHALYRLGLRDRAIISLAQYVLLGALGLLVIRRVLSNRIAPGTSSALVALFSSIFLYHRTYDMVLLVLPTLYFALSAEQRTDLVARRATAQIALLPLLVLFVNPDGLKIFERWSFNIGLGGWVIQAVFLPMAAWLILVSLAALTRVGAEEQLLAHANQHRSLRRLKIATPRSIVMPS